jgi:hypothetical protein
MCRCRWHDGLRRFSYAIQRLVGSAARTACPPAVMKSRHGGGGANGSRLGQAVASSHAFRSARMQAGVDGGAPMQPRHRLLEGRRHSQEKVLPKRLRGEHHA